MNNLPYQVAWPFSFASKLDFGSKYYSAQVPRGDRIATCVWTQYNKYNVLEFVFSCFDFSFLLNREEKKHEGHFSDQLRYGLCNWSSVGASFTSTLAYLWSIIDQRLVFAFIYSKLEKGWLRPGKYYTL